MNVILRVGFATLLSALLQADAIARQELLRPGVEIAGALQGTGTATYRIALNGNEALEVQVTQLKADLRLRLLDPAGQEVMRSNLRRTQHGSEQLHAVAASAGDHQLIVENAGAPASDVTFGVAASIRPADQRDRTLVVAAQAYRRGEIESGRGGGDAVRAGLTLFRQAAAEWKSAGATFEHATALNRVGGAEMQLSNLVDAQAAHGEALRLRREIGDQYGQGVSLNNLAATYTRQGDYQRAAELYDEAVQIRRAVGDANGEGWSLIGASLLQGTRHDGWASALLAFAKRWR